MLKPSNLPKITPEISTREMHKLASFYVIEIMRKFKMGENHSVHDGKMRQL